MPLGTPVVVLDTNAGANTAVDLLLDLGPFIRDGASIFNFCAVPSANPTVAGIVMITDGDTGAPIVQQTPFSVGLPQAILATLGGNGAIICRVTGAGSGLGWSLPTQIPKRIRIQIGALGVGVDIRMFLAAELSVN